MNKIGYLMLVFLLASQEGSRAELRLLQIVFHNGQRDPQTAHHPHRDPYRPVFWHTGPGRIAMIGMIQLFKLGQRMRRKYSDFVTVQPEEVDLYPSERGAPCGSLSQCFMSGFYRPGKEPPPLQTDVPLSQPPDSVPDEQLKEPELKCPKLQVAASKLYNDSDEGNQIIGQNMNLYQYWSANSGMEIKNPTDARELYESLQLEKSLNLSLPAWVERFWPELKRQSDIHFSWLARNQQMQKMAAGPLLGLMIQRMERHIDGYDLKKYFVYSGRNSSLAGLLAIFGAFDGTEPPFGSTVVLELHRFGTVFYVRVIYFYSTDAPEIVTLRGCSEYCPFDRFKLLTTGMVPLRWEQECGLKRDNGCPSLRNLPTLYYAVGLAWIFVVVFSY